MIGLVLAVRVRAPASRRGLWIITLSVVAAIGWVLAVATGLLSPNTTTST
jgi:CHASE2 domain-containing sensor protein